MVGAGPCGIASVGRLIDLGVSVKWIDPYFSCGRMGEFYRNFPANTTNADFITSLQACKSFEFDKIEDERRKKGLTVMSDLPPNTWAPLGLFVEILEDITKILMHKSTCHNGFVTKMEKTEKMIWSIEVSKENHKKVKTIDSEAIIYCCGCKPIELNVDAEELRKIGVKLHKLDLTVDENYINLTENAEKLKNEVWGVAGSSHSGMLVVKNLYEQGVKKIINIHRNGLKFMHQTHDGWVRFNGVGLKGPVGLWARTHFSFLANPSLPAIPFQDQNLLSFPIIDEKSPVEVVSFARYEDNIPWTVQLKKLGIQHLVVAIGFHIDETIIPKIIINKREIGLIDLNNYNKDTGSIMMKNDLLDEYSECLGLFGGGIAFPWDFTDEGGGKEPWVGFPRSVAHVDIMVSEFYNSKKS